MFCFVFQNGSMTHYFNYRLFPVAYKKKKKKHNFFKVLKHEIMLVRAVVGNSRGSAIYRQPQKQGKITVFSTIEQLCC